MYTDLIHYRRAEGVTTEALLAVAERVHRDWMVQQPGFLGWSLHVHPDGSGTDIVHWRSKEAAKAAEGTMAGMPHAAEWMACYAPGSINSQPLEQVAAFPGSGH